MLVVEFFIFIAVVIIGLKKKGSLGLMSVLVLLIYSLIFNKPIHKPALSLGLIILSVITASSSLAASGGIKLIANIIERIIIKHRTFITIIAPLFTFFATILCGTSYIVLTILPLVAKISIEEKIKPIYPLTACVIAANHGSLCSPISSPFLATTHLLNLNSNYILITMFISCFIGLLATILFNFISQRIDLKKENNIDFDNIKFEIDNIDFDVNKAKKAVLIFISGIFLLFLYGLYSNIRPKFIINNVASKCEMTLLIPLVMFSIGALISIICNIKIKDILEQKTMEFGFQSIITILGISWLSASLIENSRSEILILLNNFLKYHDFFFGIILFLASIFLASQTAAILTILPLGITLGFSDIKLLSILPFVDGLFFIPLTAIFSYAVECDKTGSTKSGKYILDHSLMIPGAIATITSVIIMYIIL